MPLRKFQRGFSLIELMIALVVGLVVSGAALALVAAIIKSNSETVRATRLTQELRATVEVIVRDLRRARSDSDPISNVGTTPLLSACNTIDTSTAGCVVYGYNCTSTTAGTFNAIAVAGGKVRLLTGTPNAKPACPTTTTGTQISSNAVNIRTLTFTQIGANAYSVLVTADLVYQPSVTNSVTLAPITRSITQEVDIRSSAVQ
jgi:prepilin-type N-terminal cleavage/methylation domain-containing protein